MILLKINETNEEGEEIDSQKAIMNLGRRKGFYRCNSTAISNSFRKDKTNLSTKDVYVIQLPLLEINEAG